MSTIEERIVNMRFNNSEFETKARQTQRTLGELNRSLNFDGAKTGLQNMAGVTSTLSAGAFASLAASAEAIADKFRVMGVVGITAIANIVTAAIHAGSSLVKSLTIDPIRTGLSEYETQLNAVQTILSNTSFKGETIETVNAALDELNKYADLTIYNFSEMARNIGTFTAAGVGLENSVLAIKGIANLAALSGSTSQQASTAMYQLSQALATGTVRLLDWNSVVNAGMGGEVFQNAIKETARAHGVAVDEIIAKNGSFRESLQEGWLTSDILLETLSKFTGDLTAEQLKAMGYTEQQIVEIQQLGSMAQDAATKVKTVTQLVSTLQEAAQSGWGQTWRILFGDLEEARTLWTGVYNVIGGMIDASSDARNQMLSDWDELGGRKEVIEAIGNAFKFVMAVLKPIGKAFRDIFPATTARQLYNITHAILEFTQGLKVGNETARNIGSTFRGFFAILDIGRMIVVEAVKMIARLLGFLFEGSDGFLDMTASVGDWLVSVRDAIKEGEGLSKFFEILETILRAPIAAVKFIAAVIGALGDTMGDVANGGGEVFKTFIENLNARLEPLGLLGQWLASVWTGVMSVLGAVARFFAPLASRIAKVFQDIGDVIWNAMMSNGSFDASGLIDVINAALAGGLIYTIIEFVNSLKGIADTVGGFKDAIIGILDGITGTLEAMQSKIKADVILKIAAAVGILALSALLLSVVDPIKLTSALVGLTTMMLQIIGAMALFSRINPKAGVIQMIALSTAMLIMASALAVLAGAVVVLSNLSWEELAKGLVGVTVLMGVLAGAAKLMSANTGAVVTSSVVLILMGVALKILASALQDIGQLSWEELVKGLLGITIVMGALVGFTALVSKINPVKMVATGVGLLLLAAAIKIIASALQSLGAMTWDEIGRGLTVMAGALVLLAVATKLMAGNILGAASLVIVAAGLLIIGQALQGLAKLSWDDIGRVTVTMLMALGFIALFLAGMGALGPVVLLGAAALITSAIALVMISGVLQQMAKFSWDEIGRITVLLLAVLGVLAVGLTLMIAALPGAAAMVVVAAALAVLAPILFLFGKMSWEEIGRALVMLAGAFAVIGVAGLLLAPVIPFLMGLGVAIALIGVGVFAAGVGLLAFATGLTALAAAGTAGTVALVAMVTGLIGLIPMAAKQLGLGIVVLLQTLAGVASALVESIVIIVLALIDGLAAIIPPLIDFIVDLLLQLWAAMEVLIPRWVEAGLHILLGILEGIAANIGDISSAATDVAAEFIRGMGDNATKLADAGAEALIDFIDGITENIDKHSAELGRAGGELAVALGQGLVNGLGSFVTTVFNSAFGLGQQAVKGAKAGMDAHSPSRETHKLGQDGGRGLVNGLLSWLDKVGAAGETVGKNAVTTMQKAIQRAAAVVNGEIEMSPVIRPVLDLSTLRADAASISGLITAPKLPVDTSYAMASEIMDERARQEQDSYYDDDDGRGGDTNYYQYITSPKAVSNAEIYRQSKNLLSRAKEDANA